MRWFPPRCRIALPVVAGLILASGLASTATAQSVINFGTGDSIALDQMRVVAAFESPDGVVRPAPGTGYTMIADTGATGILIGARGHLDFSTAESFTYDSDAAYREQGVAGFEAVDLTVPHDVTVSSLAGLFGGGDPPGSVDAFVLEDQRMLAAPDLELGSFAGIVGMPGMEGRVVVVDIGNMTPDQSGESFDVIAAGFDTTLPAAPGTGATHTFHFDRLSFDPAAGSINPGDPLPSFADLPTLEVGTGRGATDLTGDFLFDTGAQLSMITGATAQGLGLNIDLDDPDNDVLDFLPVGGVGGQTEIPIVSIDRLSLNSNEGNELIFEDLAVGVLDIEGLPVDGILGFNPFTTGYLDPILAAIADPASDEARKDGAFVEMALDFTDDEQWMMRLTQNPDFLSGENVEIVDDQFFVLDNQALFAWPAFQVPEPNTALALLVLAGLTVTRRRR